MALGVALAAHLRDGVLILAGVKGLTRGANGVGREAHKRSSKKAKGQKRKALHEKCSHMRSSDTIQNSHIRVNYKP